MLGWATTIVAPPDGSMESYLKLINALANRKDRVFLPGHGGPVDKPQRHARALRTHRLAREAAIFNRVQAGDRNVVDIVANVYQATDKRLHGAAALTALAHLNVWGIRGKSRYKARLASTLFSNLRDPEAMPIRRFCGFSKQSQLFILSAFRRSLHSLTRNTLARWRGLYPGVERIHELDNSSCIGAKVIGPETGCAAHVDVG